MSRNRLKDPLQEIILEILPSLVISQQSHTSWDFAYIISYHLPHKFMRQTVLTSHFLYGETESA